MSWRVKLSLGLASLLVIGVTALMFASINMRDMVRQKGVSGAYLVANMASRANQSELAGDFYTRALDIDPADPDLLRAAMQAHLMAGSIRQAGMAAQDLVDNAPAGQQAHFLLAIVAFKEQKIDLAVKHLDQTRPGPLTRLLEPNIRLWVAAAQDNQSEIDKALEKLQTMSAFSSVSLAQAALYYDMKGDISRARQLYRRAARAGGLAGLGLALDYGAFLHRLGEPDKARAAYEMFYKSNLPHPAIDAALEAVAQQAEPPAAPVFDPLVGLGKAMFGLAEAMRREGRLELALAYARLSAYLDGDNDFVKMQTAETLAALKNYRLAADLFAAIGDETVLHREAQIRRAEMLQQLGASESAISVLTGVLQNSPGHVRALVALGDIYRGDERFEEAETSYDRAIQELPEEQPLHWHVYFARGIARERLGDWEQAEIDLLTARRLSNDEPHVLNYLGYSWIDKGMYLQEALQIIVKAVKQKPNNGFFVDSLGWAYYRLGDYDKALFYLERATQLQPTDPVITDHLGDALWQLGRRLEARYQWRKALAFEPEDNVAQSIDEKLLLGLQPKHIIKQKPRLPRGGTAI